MSIPVPVEELERALRDFGAGYLLTTGGERIKAVTVEPAIVGNRIAVAASRGSAANIQRNAAVTLLFPPRSPQGYTLLIDGAALILDDGIEVIAEKAVLHRPAAHADAESGTSTDSTTGPGGDACGHDCRPVG